MARHFQPLVVYYGVWRPSKRRGDRTLGDRETAERYARENDGHIVEHYREPGNRYKTTRPALAQALKRAQEAGALLVIPMFNPYARDSVFLTQLWESGVEFVACDNPHANKTTLPLLASIVAEESQWISARAKTALAKRKRRKERLGTPTNLTDEGRRRGAAATREAHQVSLGDKLEARLKALRAEGKSLREIAAFLTAERSQTSMTTRWSHTRVRRLFLRMDELDRLREAHKAEWIAAGSPRRPRPKRRPSPEDSE